MAWLIFAMLLLLAMRARIEIKYKARGRTVPERNLSLSEFMAFPYLPDRRLIQYEEMAEQVPLTHRDFGEQTKSTRDNDAIIQSSADSENLITGKPVAVYTDSVARDHSPAARSEKDNARFGHINSSSIIVRVTMPSEKGLFSWRWYESILEALAVGIYLYATIVLTSIQFISGSTGLIFASIMAVCMSVVRILGEIF
jgi:hypothetical protein